MRTAGRLTRRRRASMASFTSAAVLILFVGGMSFAFYIMLPPALSWLLQVGDIAAHRIVDAARSTRAWQQEAGERLARFRALSPEDQVALVEKRFAAMTLAEKLSLVSASRATSRTCAATCSRTASCFYR